MGAIQDFEPIRRWVTVTDKDINGEEITEEFWVDILEFSEEDIRKRMKFLSEPVSGEDSRRGRSSRGRRGGSEIQIQRLRQFNFEYAVVDWNLAYPKTEWDRQERRRKEHPLAGQKLPIDPPEAKRKSISMLSGRTSEQISDHIDSINEPPEELPALKNEAGEVIEEAQESPLVPS